MKAEPSNTLIARHRERCGVGVAAMAGLALLAGSGTAGAVSFQVPGTDTTLDIGGYVKLDVIYNSRSNGDNNQNNVEFGINGIPLDGTETGEKNQIVFNGRESRMWLKTSTPTGSGPLNTHLEFDFDTNEGNQLVSNSHGARIRHAYGTHNNWLIGRTWTAFMYFPGLPEVNDFGGPMGATFIRQGQVRYTWNMDGGSSFLLSFENPETFLVPGGAFGAAYDDDTMPDIVARYTSDHWSVAALVRRLAVDTGVVDESTTGAGLQLGGWMPVGSGGDKVGGQITVGKGVGRYNALAATFDAYFDTSGSLEALQTTGGLVYYQHNWSPTSRSTIALGFFSSDDPAELASSGSVNKEGTSLHINYMWNPTKQLRHGIELIVANREVMNGTEGELNRVQWSSRFMF